jgi:hypothetical protein
MQIAKGFIAGIIAAGVMTLAMAFLRFAGMSLAFELLLGSFVTSDPANAWLAGFGMHLLVGGLAGVLYGAVFEWITGGAGWSIGAAVGVLHAAVAGLALGLLPFVHPRIPEPLPAPGFYMASFGILGVFTFFAMHLLFGAIVGEVYRPVKVEHRRPFSRASA